VNEHGVDIYLKAGIAEISILALKLSQKHYPALEDEVNFTRALILLQS
jgi:hypothetical protein